MTTTEIAGELEELTAWIAANHQRIPPHRRAQAVRLLERVESLVRPEPPAPTPDVA